jgi:hypothetical protein
MLMTLLMIIMAIIAASGFIALGLSFLDHKLRVEEERERRDHKHAVFQATQTAGWPAG